MTSFSLVVLSSYLTKSFLGEVGMLFAIVESLLFYFYVRLHMYFDTERNYLK